MRNKILSNKAYPVVFLAVIVIVSVVLLMVIDSITSPIVKNTQVEEIKNTLRSIFPEMSQYELKDEIYIIYQDGEKAGYAFMASGSGYSGNIDIIVGLDSGFDIKGLSILSQTETPGVGSRITENSFTDQFKGLSASDIVLKVDGGKIDAVTGATISSRAVVNGIQEKMIEIIDTLEK